MSYLYLVNTGETQSGSTLHSFPAATCNIDHLKTALVWAIFTTQLIIRLKIKCYEKGN